MMVYKMEHITEQYGSPTNLMRCTNKEFWMLKEALGQIGVEVRMTICSGDDVTFQMRNAYKENITLFNNLSADQIREMTEKDIKKGYWCR